jgi:tetrahydromethanopterin S-methyltransferase F subunit
MNKATINSIKIKNESLEWQKQMILNDTGMISGMQTELKS